MRKLIIKRKKNLLACNAVHFIVKLDGQPVAKLKNGETVELPISSASHRLEFLNSIPMGNKDPDPVTIPAGCGDCNAFLAIDSSNPGLVKTRWKLSLECLPGDPVKEREEAVSFLLGFMLMSMEPEGERSIVSKLEEFRRADLDLHIIYEVGATAIVMFPEERLMGCVEGEPIEMNYRELTAAAEHRVVEAMTMDERLYIAKGAESAKESAKYDRLNIVREGTRLDISLK